MTFNFFLNNALTYRDKRLRGFWRVLGRLFSFYLVCSVGTISNVGIANALFSRSYSWVISGIAGIVVGAVWNFAASSVFTWREKNSSPEPSAAALRYLWLFNRRKECRFQPGILCSLHS